MSGRGESTELDVAVLGAGPYGLSVAAHLAGKARVRVFGRPMQTWRKLMPADMLLRSDWDSTSLSAPMGQGGLTHWQQDTGIERTEPIPLSMFLRYANWFQERFVPDVDCSNVAQVEYDNGVFRLETVGGGSITAANLIVAPGVIPFSFVPEALRSVGAPRVTLAIDPHEEESVSGLRVAVIGGGQNGLEAALRALRAGARSVDVVVRSSVHWFADHEPYHERGAIGTRLYRLAYPIVGFGPPPINRIVLYPDLFARLPESVRQRINKRLLRAGGSPWMREQLVNSVHFHEGCVVSGLDDRADAIRIVMNNRPPLNVDRVIVACGFKFDRDRMSFLAPSVRNRIQTRSNTGWPVLTRSMESTCRGLYLLGYPAEGQFGPLSRFVEGTRFAAERCASSILTN